MKNIYFKVNRRCVGVAAVLIMSLYIYNLSLTVQAGNLFDDFLNGVIPPGAQTGDYSQEAPNIPTPTPIGYAYPSTTPGAVLPTGTPSVPVGECLTGLNRALNNLDAVASRVIPVYQQASAQSGIPWEIFAAIHYVETGGSFNPNGSLISGRPLGTPEPDQGNKIYTTLLESAIDAANVFKSKYGSTSGPFNDFQRLVRAFALYNGPGNRQCTDTGMVKPQSRYTGCPRLYDYEDHLYPLACYDARHENMWYIYCSDGQVCPPISATNPGIKYSPSKVGTLTLIAGIQARNQPTSTPSPTPLPPLSGTPAPTGGFTPIVIAGLSYFPQCASSAVSGAYWSSHTMPGCGTYCGYGCGIASSAMIYSSLSGDIKDPEEFMSLYTQNGAPNCLINYSILRNLYGTHNIDTQTPLVLPVSKSLFSSEGSALVDGYLQSGQTMLVMGTISGYNHFVWIVGKENGHYNVMDPYWSAPPAGSSPAFPIIPYTSNRYSMFMIKSILPVKRHI